MHAPNLDQLPHVKKWLELSDSVKEEVRKIEEKETVSEKEKYWLTEQLNIVEQMRRLMTYPYINEKVENETLHILGINI